MHLSVESSNLTDVKLRDGLSSLVFALDRTGLAAASIHQGFVSPSVSCDCLVVCLCPYPLFRYHSYNSDVNSSRSRRAEALVLSLVGAAAAATDVVVFAYYSSLCFNFSSFVDAAVVRHWQHLRYMRSVCVCMCVLCLYVVCVRVCCVYIARARARVCV